MSRICLKKLGIPGITIKIYCKTINICTLGGLPFFYVVAEKDNAPGLVLIGMTIAGIAFIIYVFASVLYKLLQDAIVIKTENDLTI